MNKITVYHPMNPTVNNGSTLFTGEFLRYAKRDDGSLYISNWQTPTEEGDACFAKDQWAYVCASSPRRTE